ncbi:hypothetical protein CPC08DRAFT_771487 [Agrocybe pediades]|nr:hypothetical protein CPC08DRAFT_771504 [Agrocybe pediades]KAF9536666.1 hypothetical protein CPC08DRAFT_771487 [Agrocybe pediades]
MIKTLVERLSGDNSINGLPDALRRCVGALLNAAEDDKSDQQHNAEQDITDINIQTPADPSIPSHTAVGILTHAPFRLSSGIRSRTLALWPLASSPVIDFKLSEGRAAETSSIEGMTRNLVNPSVIMIDLRQTPSSSGAPFGSSFLFGVKSDEPYMMYRHWGEATKSLLSAPY